MADAWGGAFGSAWGVSWGAGDSPSPSPSPTPTSGGKDGVWMGRAKRFEGPSRVEEEYRLKQARIRAKRKLILLMGL